MMSASSPLLQRALLALWLLHGITSGLFVNTDGLAYADPDKPDRIAHVNELESSGGNDNFSIEMGIVFAAVGVLWAGFRARSGFALRDLGVHLALVAGQATYLAALEMGSIRVTIAQDHNWALTLWVTTYASLIAVLGIALSRAVLRITTRRAM